MPGKPTNADQAALAEGLEENVKLGIHYAVEKAMSKTNSDVAGTKKEVKHISAEMAGLKEELKGVSKGMEENMSKMMEDNMAKMMAMMKGLLDKSGSDQADQQATVDNTQPEPKPKSIPRVNTAFKPDELTLDFTLAAFKTWKARFQDYYRMNAMEGLPDENQAAHLRSCISMRTQDHLRIFMSMSPDAKWSEILELLERYFTEQSNVTSRRVEFSNC